MTQNIQAILQEDLLFQKEKQQLQVESIQRVKSRKHRLEIEIASLKAELMAASKEARDQANKVTELSDEQVAAIASQKKALKEVLKKRSKVAVETITHILQEEV